MLPITASDTALGSTRFSGLAVGSGARLELHPMVPKTLHFT